MNNCIYTVFSFLINKFNSNSKMYNYSINFISQESVESPTQKVMKTHQDKKKEYLDKNNSILLSNTYGGSVKTMTISNSSIGSIIDSISINEGKF